MIASLIITGDEITRGLVQDGHVKRLGSMLDSMGIVVERDFLVRDSAKIGECIKLARQDSDIIITTGGLGPTQDDRTRDEISLILSCPLAESAVAMENVKRRIGCASLNSSNARQALIPDGFEVLENPAGTAPGFHAVVSGKLFICLPGPPRELEMMLPSVRSIILRFIGEATGSSCDTYSLFLVSEARFNELSSQALAQMGNPSAIKVGTCFKDFKTCIYVYGEDEALRRHYASLMRSLLQDEHPLECLYEGDADVFLDFRNLLRERHLTVSTAESMTGGYVSKLITDAPGSSEWFLSGIVSYSNAVKIGFLGVDPQTIARHTEVSAECAGEMSKGCAKAFGSDVAIAITGYAGPAGDEVGKVFISVAFGKGIGCRTLAFKFNGDRQFVRKRAAVASILLARETLNGRSAEP